MFTYDRRGRGESGDTTPYAVEREIVAAGDPSTLARFAKATAPTLVLAGGESLGYQRNAVVALADVLPGFGAGVEERLQARLDVVHLRVADRAREALAILGD